MTKPPSPPDKPVAIALRYARDIDDAPRVVAKGQGEVADSIRRIAQAHGVPVRQDASLASLLDAVEIDSVIPVEAYVAVAQILSYIYRRPAADATRGPRT